MPSTQNRTSFGRCPSVLLSSPHPYCSRLDPAPRAAPTPPSGPLPVCLQIHPTSYHRPGGPLHTTCRLIWPWRGRFLLWRAPSSGSTHGGDGSLILQPSLPHLLFSTFFLSFLFVWMQNSIFFCSPEMPDSPSSVCAATCAPPSDSQPRVESTTGGAIPIHYITRSRRRCPIPCIATAPLFPILPLHNSSRCRGGGTSLSFSRNQGMLRRHGVGGRACAQYGLLCDGCGGANKEDLNRSCLCCQLHCRSLHRAAGRPTHQGKRVAGWQRARGHRGPAVRHDVGRVKLPCTTDGERERRATAPDSTGQRRETEIAHPSSGATLNYAGPPAVR
jgi:hypothetical protein